MVQTLPMIEKLNNRSDINGHAGSFCSSYETNHGGFGYRIMNVEEESFGDGRINEKEIERILMIWCKFYQ